MSDAPPATIGEAGEPFDDALHRILAAAPDRAELPDWRVRQAILLHAREAVKDSEELMLAEREPSAWAPLAWLAGKRQGRSRTPWRAAFATLAVAVLATLMWQREPIPGARLDSVSDVDVQRAETKKNKEEQPPARAAESSPAPTPTPAPAPGDSSSMKSRPSSPPTEPPKPSVEREPTTPSAPPPNTSPSAAQEMESSALAKSAPAPTTLRDAATTARDEASAKPQPPAAPQSAATQRQSAPANAAPSAVATPVPPGTRTDATPPPNFVSLNQWRQMRIANSSGDVRILTRAEAGDLTLLMGSAAIMAVGPQPLTTLPEWRVSLERNGGVLAVLEVSRTQVRWTEGASPPATGAPPTGALDALRAGLRSALESPVARPVREKPLPIAPKEPAKLPATQEPPAPPVSPALSVPTAPAMPAPTDLAPTAPPTPLELGRRH